MRQWKTTSGLLVFSILYIIAPLKSISQNTVPQQDSASEAMFVKRGVVKDSIYENYASGEFTPGRGFDMVKTKYGSLNISLYAIARYLNLTWGVVNALSFLYKQTPELQSLRVPRHEIIYF